MPSEADRAALLDIRSNIEFAFQFLEGFDAERFSRDFRTFYAVVRCLEIVSEASRRLSPELKSRHARIPWRQIAGAGNVYRHDYEDVAQRLVWGTVEKFLPTLRAVVDGELSRP